VALQGDGRFVVVWMDMEPPRTVLARLFDGAGKPLGLEFPVDPGATHWQLSPAVAAGPDGSFVVAWGTYDFSAYEARIRARRFGGGGAPLGPGFEVSEGTFNWQPSVAAAADGNFVVAWIGEDSSYSGIEARRFDEGGNPSGAEFVVNVWTAGDQTRPEVATDATGRFVVVWEGAGPYGEPLALARRYDASGAPLGGEIEVGTAGATNQLRPAVAVGSAGEFTVVWERGVGTYDLDVVGRRFDSAGGPSGDEFRVNAYTSGFQQAPRIRADGTAGFLVVWAGSGQDGDGLFGRRFAADAHPLGAEFAVNAETAGQLGFQEVAVGSSGDFVVVWMTAIGDPVDFDLRGRRFRAPFFCDGFETGDTGAWSLAVP
jgi:hypothetical protein